jgi:hypothetical protein
VKLRSRTFRPFTNIVAKGKHNSHEVLNALILLNYDEDAPEPRTLKEQEIANVLQVSAMKIHRVKQRFVEEGGHCAQRLYPTLEM